METTNEEKVIDTLQELLTTPSTTTAHANTPLVHKTTCLSTNIAAPHTANMQPQAKPQQHKPCQANLITQDEDEVEDKPPQHHQYNLWSRAQLNANSLYHTMNIICISFSLMQSSTNRNLDYNRLPTPTTCVRQSLMRQHGHLWNTDN